MRRRTFCRAFVLLPLGALFAACDHAKATAPLLSAEVDDTLRGMDRNAIVAMLLGTVWGSETPTPLRAGYSIRDFDFDAPVAVTVAFYPDFHRISYAVFDTPDAAATRYEAGAAALRADRRGRADAATTGPYPTTTIFYEEGGHGLILAGPILTHVIVAHSNRDFFTALVSASTTHLALALAKKARG